MRPYTDQELEKACVVWQFYHKGVAYEVNHHSRYTNNGAGIWCYYLLINENSLTQDEFNELWLKDIETPYGITHEYYPVFGFLDLHGGPTFYEKKSNRKGHRFVKVGCDYNHLWDHESGFPFDLNWIKRDAEISIESLLQRFPDFKVMCRWDGTYHPVAEIGEDGYWIHRKKEEPLVFE